MCRKMKLARKREQDLNIEKKKREKQEHKKKCLQGMGYDPNQVENGNADEDNDADWYRKEVGEEPDEGRDFFKVTLLWNHIF